MRQHFKAFLISAFVGVMLVLFGVGVHAGPDAFRGYLGTDVLTVVERSAPAASSPGTTQVFMDSADHSLKVSQNGGGYSSLLTNATALYCRLTGGTGCAIVATAVASTAETLQTWNVSDMPGAGGAAIVNTSTTDAYLHPALAGSPINYTAPSIGMNGLIAAVGDIGTSPMVSITGSRSAAFTSFAPSALLTTRPVLGIYNYTTELLEVSAGGAITNPGSSTCGSISGSNGAVCMNDSLVVGNTGSGSSILFMSSGTIYSTASNGAATQPLSIVASGISQPAVNPAAMTADVNDYALCTAGNCRIDSGAAARNVTGMTGGVDGRNNTICAVGANTITLVHESVSSIAANRFKLPGAVNRIIAVDECITTIYDSTTARWRMVN